MHRDELKQTLKEQFEPLENAVRKKLAYLQSDDVFSDYMADEAEQYTSTNNISIEDAFATFSDAQSYYIEEQSPKELNNGAHKPLSSIKVEKPTTESIQRHKQNIAAKIAALRGISMPGDYLNKKL